MGGETRRATSFQELRVSKSALMLLVLGVCGAGYYVRERSSSCVVGVTGAEASVTITGFRSNAACEDMVRSRPNETYLRQSAPDGAVLCEFQRGRSRYVVRDRGALMVVGRAMCASMQNQQPTSR
jgi:hypothetical protein